MAGSAFTIENVVTFPAPQNVAAVAAIECVIAGASDERVGCVFAIQSIVTTSRIQIRSLIGADGSVALKSQVIAGIGIHDVERNRANGAIAQRIAERKGARADTRR